MENLTVKIKRERPRAPSRKLPGRNTAAFREYAQRIGIAVLAWNDLHANLYMIFWHVIGLNDDFQVDEQMANRIWHTIQSDKTQREMLKNAADVKLLKNKRVHAALEWILKQTDILSQGRNLAAHMPVIFHPAGNTPRADPWSSKKNSKDIYKLIDHAKFWKLFAGDLSALSRYTARLAEHLMGYGTPRPLFGKPVLQSIDEIDRINKLIQARKVQAQAPQPKVAPRKVKRGIKPKK